MTHERDICDESCVFDLDFVLHADWDAHLVFDKRYRNRLAHSLQKSSLIASGKAASINFEAQPTDLVACCFDRRAIAHCN